VSQRDLGRRIFLNIARTSEPRVLVSLYQAVFPVYLEKGEDLVRADPALREWCSGWHLCDSWILDIAIDTLRWWKQATGPFSTPGQHWCFPDPPPAGWSGRGRRRPRGLTEADTLASISEDQRRRPESPARQYEWLAAWQIGRFSHGELAGKAGVTRGAVIDAIRKTAHEIGLTRRSESSVPTPKETRTRSHRRGPHN
jgi:hypothetical protein